MVTKFKWTWWKMYMYSDHFIIYEYCDFLLPVYVNEVKFMLCCCFYQNESFLHSYFFLFCHFIKIQRSVLSLEKNGMILQTFKMFYFVQWWKNLKTSSLYFVNLSHLDTLLFQFSSCWLCDETLKGVKDSLSSSSYR